ncbi:MAG: hypothetical protein A3K10_03825 [Bacteroidetes bacterium RIFCSPLOWO2_12_FULL_31_6]|nr:MAG: hypothetical protein A3K10_03825 [Bacteroidetes bacterium RIFCSPLOWO2_12_FULL_31_6]
MGFVVSKNVLKIKKNNMKKYDTLFLSLGTFLSLFPIYAFFGWIYVCIIYPELSQPELVAMYNSQLLFDFFNARSLFFTVCGLLAGILLLISLVYSLQNNGNKTLKTIKVILFVMNAFFTFFQLWSLM